MLYFYFSTELKEILYYFHVTCNLPDNTITATYLFWCLQGAIYRQRGNLKPCKSGNLWVKKIEALTNSVPMLLTGN